MPQFAANLSFIFQEVGFLDRFAAAAACGFKAVEYLSPCDHPPEVIAEQLTRHGLEQALFNMPPGDWAAGERGIGALPGREREFRDGVETALVYARATKCRSRRFRYHAPLRARIDVSVCSRSQTVSRSRFVTASR